MKPLLAIAALCLLSACTAEQAYNSGQGWQANQCNRSADASERDRCQTQPATSYGDYKAQTGQ